MNLSNALLLCFSFVTLAGCAGGSTRFVAPNAKTGAADIQRIYLATDRVLAPDLSGTTTRGGTLSFAQYDVTIPPGRRPGDVKFSAKNPDPKNSWTPPKTLARRTDL